MHISARNEIAIPCISLSLLQIYSRNTNRI